MGFLNLSLGGLQEKHSVPEGRYRLVIASAEEGESREKKTPQFKVTINIEGHPNAYPVTHWLSIPSNKDEPKTAESKALFLKRFLVLFNVPHTDDGFDPDDLVGASADAELSLTDPEDSDNKEVFNRLVVPKLRTGEPSGPVAVDQKIKAAASGAGRKR